MTFQRFLFISGFMLLLGACSTLTPGTPNSGTGDVACTMEAKLCPDGSYVGRTGPNCEFAPCPSITASGSSASSAMSGTGEQLSFGALTITRDTASFGLAASPAQILVQSYIPPCEDGFDYCLYYTGTAYEGTNFEGAGLGIVRRTDLSDRTMCLQTRPDGYTQLIPSIQEETGYATTKFAPLGDAGAGHFTNEELFRIYVDNGCYELRTRIGQTQFASYPEGTINEFTEQDEEAVRVLLREQIEMVTLSDGSRIVWP